MFANPYRPSLANAKANFQQSHLQIQSHIVNNASRYDHTADFEPHPDCKQELSNLRQMICSFNENITEQIQNLSALITERNKPTVASNSNQSSKDCRADMPSDIRNGLPRNKPRKYNHSSPAESSTEAEPRTMILSCSLNGQNNHHQSTRRFNKRHHAKFPGFDGKEQWKVWFTRFQDIGNRCGWTEEEKLDELLPRLQGPPAEFVYDQLPGRVRQNFKLLVKELDSRYIVIETTKSFAGQFSHRGQRDHDTFENYAADLKHLYDKAYPNHDPTTRNEDLLRRFLDGLYDDRTRFHVEYSKEPQSIDEAVYQAVNCQETKKNVFSQDQYGGNKTYSKPTRQLHQSENHNQVDIESDQRSCQSFTTPDCQSNW